MMADEHAHPVDGRRCTESHYAVIVKASKEPEIYQLGDVDCPVCLRWMADQHEQLAKVFRARLSRSLQGAR